MGRAIQSFPRAGTTAVAALRFEALLCELSSRLANVSPEKLDAEIQHGIKRLVEFLGAGRARLSTRANQAVKILCSSPAEGASPARPLKSQLEILVAVEGQPLCVLEIAAFKETRPFSAKLIRRLRVIAEIFANAVARREANRELRRLHDELAHVTRVSTVGQLAASIAHEINQPLCAIQSNAHAADRLLAKPDPDLPDVRTALSEIIADTKRASMVVFKAHGMLKRRELEFTDCSINEVTRDVLMLLHSDSLIRRIPLRTELTEKLPSVKADRVQLQQVIMNLVLNAMDSTIASKNEGREITLKTEAIDDGVRATVIDSGAGMPPEVLTKMFDPFFTTKEHGLGMGLAINRDIIQAHGGRIWAANRQPRGASVGFFLPSATQE